ncbi:MAG: hypothetical protein LC708_00315, partial [Actinobacteria bacterium]|nr:hypothetical protein [Actinomycetota bacterium]
VGMGMLTGTLVATTLAAADAAAGGALVPVLLKDVNPGSASSSPSRFTVAGTNLLFTATDATHGQEWQKTDGTTAGTTLVKDIRTGSGDAGISSTVGALGGRLFFGADDGTYTTGNEPWSTDGTAAGTVLLKDIFPGGGGGAPPGNFVAAGGTLFFTAQDGANGAELWKTDGTAAGTVMVRDINPGANGSSPQRLTAVGNNVFFAAYGSATGWELWKSDGTAAGTVLVRDINPGLLEPNISNMVVVGTTAYFSATNGTSALGNGQELWKSDGTTAGTVLVKDIRPGTTGSSPVSLAVVGSTVYFQANDGSSGTELWKSDGTAAGTLLVKDILPGVGGSLPSDLTAFGDILLLRGTGPDPAGGAELWKSDGTSAGTVLVKDISAGSASGSPTGFAVVGTTAFFSATDGSTGAAHGTELWSTDGTSAGTVLVQDINPGTASSSPSSLTPALGTLFFAAADGVTGVEPWKLRTNQAPVAGDILT